MGVSNISVVMGFVLLFDFFFDDDLVAGSTGCSTICRGIGAVRDFGMYCGAFGGDFGDDFRGDFSESVLLAGEAVAVTVTVEGLSSTFFGDFFFFLVTSVQPSSAFLGLTWPDSFAVVLLMVAVVIVAVVVVVEAVETAALGGSFLGQNLDICPSCLQLQQHGRRPSTTTIICLSLLMRISGMAWKPSLVRHSWNMWSPEADLRRLDSSTRPYLLRNAASSSPVIVAGTLQTVTRPLRVPTYSGCSRKNFVIVDDAALAACSWVGSRTSHVGKLRLQKYRHGMPAFRRRSSNDSFFSPTSHLFLNLKPLVTGSLVPVFQWSPG